MTGSVRRKIKGGKLLHVRVEHDPSFITKVTLTGDFFIHPEEGIDALERSLEGVPITEGEQGLAFRIEKTARENGLALIGFAPSDLASAVKEALR